MHGFHPSTLHHVKEELGQLCVTKWILRVNIIDLSNDPAFEQQRMKIFCCFITLVDYSQGSSVYTDLF
ncbi:MAG: hypothetical protein PF439_11840 [Helicobacteraceae bacterium]|jgi:hypothetical protein|nr:hypothetical protein [Helicobacteraceae bacterium]